MVIVFQQNGYEKKAPEHIELALSHSSNRVLNDIDFVLASIIVLYNQKQFDLASGIIGAHKYLMKEIGKEANDERFLKLLDEINDAKS